MKKHKSRSQITTSGLHYVLGISLEEAAERMLQLQLDGYVVQVTGYPNEDDYLEVVVRRKWTKKRVAKVQVFLQRWQGTQTRIDMQTERPQLGVRWYILGIALSAVLSWTAVQSEVIFLFLFGILAIFAAMLQQFAVVTSKIQSWQLSSELLGQLDKHIDDVKAETLHFGRGLRAASQAEDLFDMVEEPTPINDIGKK